MAIKVYCDFNDSTDDERYWILYFHDKPLAECVAELDLRDGDIVTLYSGEEDFEVEAVLLFAQRVPRFFIGEKVCARPNWSTLTRKGSSPS